MIREDEIEDIKSRLDSDGKIIISDNMSEAQKERYSFINSMNIDLIDVLSRKNNDLSEGEQDLDDSSVYSNEDEVLDDVEALDTNEYSTDIVENDESVDDLNSIF